MPSAASPLRRGSTESLCRNASTVSEKTESEALFERLCALRGLECESVPRVQNQQTPDYRVLLDGSRILVEIKQLDPTPKDKELQKAMLSGLDIGPVSAPTPRVRNQIAYAYRQLKSFSSAGQPCVIVLYNNAGVLNAIDSFIVSSAMFGQYGVSFAVPANPRANITVTSQRFFGERRVSRNECRGISGVAVLKIEWESNLTLRMYHNPFAKNPIARSAASKLVTHQYQFDNPHEGQFVVWEPREVTA